MSPTPTMPGAPPSWGLTTEQVVAQSGVSKVTLRQWQGRGLLHPPYIYTDPNGRGRRAYWQPATVELVRELRALGGRGVPLQSVVKRRDLAAMAGSSISSGTAREMAERWWKRRSAGDLAEAFGNDPDIAHRAFVLAAAVERLARRAGLRDEAAQAMGDCANISLLTVLHNFINGIESVVVWNGRAAKIVPKVELDAFHLGDTDALAQVLADGPDDKPRSESFNSPVLTSVELTSLVRDLWKHYGESLVEGESVLPSFTLSRGSTVRDSTGLQGDAPQHVEYDYTLWPSGFGDDGCTIDIDTATARLADQGPSARFWLAQQKREATQRGMPSIALIKTKRSSRGRTGTGRAVKRKATRK